MNQHISDMTLNQLSTAFTYCKSVANDSAAPMQLREEARDLAIEIEHLIAEHRAGAK